MSQTSPETASDPMPLERPDGWIVKNKHGAIELFLHHERAMCAFNAWGSFIGPVYQRAPTSGLAPTQQQPITDMMIEAGARVAATRRGHKNCDDLVTIADGGKVAVWKFYTDEPREILEAMLAVSNTSTDRSPVMQAADKAAKVVEGWSDAKREYAGRVTDSSPDRNSK
jgi:hypothetical protein